MIGPTSRVACRKTLVPFLLFFTPKHGQIAARIGSLSDTGAKTTAVLRRKTPSSRGGLVLIYARTMYTFTLQLRLVYNMDLRHVEFFDWLVKNSIR